MILGMIIYKLDDKWHAAAAYAQAEVAYAQAAAAYPHCLRIMLNSAKL